MTAYIDTSALLRIVWREAGELDDLRLPAIATHDSMLGTAALAFGFDVLGM